MTDPKEVQLAKVLAVYPDAYAEESPIWGWRLFSCRVGHPYQVRLLGRAETEQAAWILIASRLPAREEPRQVIVAVHGDHGNLAVFDNRHEADDYIRVEGNGSEVVDLSRVSRDEGGKYHEQQCDAPIPSATEQTFEEWWDKVGRLFFAGDDVHVQRAVMGISKRAWNAAKGVSR